MGCCDALKIFPTKRRGGVGLSCMLFIRLMQETRFCTQDFLISYEKKGWCRALMHAVYTTHAGDKSCAYTHHDFLRKEGVLSCPHACWSH